MKKLLTPLYLPPLVLGAGSVGLLLRVWHQISGLDAKGLPIRGHIAEILLWILTAITVVGIFLLTRCLTDKSNYFINFPPSLIGAVGAAIGALGIGMTSVITLTASAVGIDVICGWAGILVAVLLLYLGFCRMKGLRPTASAHTVIALYLMLRLISFYRHWSADPILLDYCFQLLANVCLMLAVYQRAAFSARLGRRHSYVFFALTGIYFCCLSLVAWEDIILYLAMAVWMLTDLCDLTLEETQ